MHSPLLYVSDSSKRVLHNSFSAAIKYDSIKRMEVNCGIYPFENNFFDCLIYVDFHNSITAYTTVYMAYDSMKNLGLLTCKLCYNDSFINPILLYRSNLIHQLKYNKKRFNMSQYSASGYIYAKSSQYSVLVGESFTPKSDKQFYTPLISISGAKFGRRK